MGIPSKLNRYRRAGKRGNGGQGSEDSGKDAGKDKGKRNDNSLEDADEEMGEEPGLTLIKVRLFKNVKTDEVSIDWYVSCYFFSLLLFLFLFLEAPGDSPLVLVERIISGGCRTRL